MAKFYQLDSIERRQKDYLEKAINIRKQKIV